MPDAPPNPFDHQPRTRIVFGLKAAERAGELARETGIKKALLVTDPGLVAAGHAGPAPPGAAPGRGRNRFV